MCFLLVLAAATPARAQMATPLSAPTDVMLRTDGREVVGRVLTITPLELCYLSPAGADTLYLPAADVFLVRFANGTREVLHPLPPAGAAAPDPLPGLTTTDRHAQGRPDANRCDRVGGPLWA